MSMSKKILDSISNQEEDFHRLIKELFPRRYSIVSEANDSMAELLQAKYDFRVLEYASGSSLNGWEIPQEWVLLQFSLKKDDVEIFNEKSKEVWVTEHSPDVSATYNYEDLLSHINVGEPIQPDSIPWDWRNLYKIKQDRQWSIGISASALGKLSKDSKYQVLIKGTTSNRKMKVLVSDSRNPTLPTILINAHNCHPNQFNDDLSGVISAVLLQKILKELDLRINVRTILAPEHYGPMFYLDSIFQNVSHENKNGRKTQFLGCILLASIAEGHKIRFQESADENSLLNFVVKKLSKTRKYESFKFRELHGNDEIVFECPPFRIPTITVTRFPFKNYHTTADIPTKQSWKMTKQAIQTVLEILLDLEGQQVFAWESKGLPKYDSPSRRHLFKPAFAPNLNSKRNDSDNVKWNMLMNRMPMFIDQGLSAEQIAERVSLDLTEVRKYLELFEASGIIRRRY